ncbi:MAG: metallophosphoesterase [Gammaproteobacteria bacterium]|jgi:predicted MPP superfamily phosphohydrolase
MPFPLKLILSVVIVVLMALWVMLPARFDVVAPRLGMPVIVKPGATIELRIISTLPFWQPQWQVSLALREQQVPLQITKQKINFNKQLVSVQIPETVAAASYSIIVSDGQNEISRPKAVHVVTEFPDQVSIVQMADLPTLGRGDGDQRLQQIIDEINIINPELVLMTGDIAYGGTWDQYHRLLAAMKKINAPVIAAPGNHEYEGWAGYLTLLGEPYHSVQYGNYQIIGLNSGHGRDQLTEAQFDWLLNELENLDGRVPLVQLHHPMHHRPDLRGYVANHVADMVRAFKRMGVPIVLSGHWHGDAVYDARGNDRRDTWDFPGIPYVVTTAAGADLREKYSSSPLHHGYRLIQLDKSKLVSYTYDMDRDGERDATSSIPMGKLRSMPQANGSILVENELNESFPNARVQISIPGNNVSLVPDKGTLVNRYINDGQSYYEIEFPLAANSQQQIQLISESPRI